MGWFRAFLVTLSQIVGGIAASAVVAGLFPGPLAVRTTLSTTPHTSVIRGLLIEMVLTAELVFTMYELLEDAPAVTDGVQNHARCRETPGYIPGTNRYRSRSLCSRVSR